MIPVNAPPKDKYLFVQNPFGPVRKPRKKPKCVGRIVGGARCSINVPSEGDYCARHQNQKPVTSGIPCKCVLPTGSACPYDALETGFCEFHLDPVRCKGVTSQNLQCGVYIPIGSTHCFECKKKNSNDVILPAVLTKIESIRRSNIKKGRMVIPYIKRSDTKSLHIDVVVPAKLKRRDIEKPSECGICLDEMSKDYRRLDCSHYFHLDCLSKMYEAKCPNCRKPINAACLPKWVNLRIEENKSRRADERIQEHEMATRDFIQNIVREELLDMNSSQEDDLDTHIENGREFGLTLAVDEEGIERLAVIVLGTTP